jgi:hypothetical protein
MRTITALLLRITLSAADEFDDAVRKLFNADAESRAEARAFILEGGEAALQRLLDTLEKRVAAKAAQVEVVRFYEIHDLVQDKVAHAKLKQRVFGLGKRIEVRQNVLVVYATPAVHARIRKILDEVRRTSGPFVRIETRIVRVPANARLPHYVRLEQLPEFLKRFETVSAPALVCRDTQRANVSILEQVSYVADFEVSVAKGRLVADPVVKTIDSGERIALQPFVKRSGIRIAIDAEVTELKLPMETTEIRGLDVEVQIPETRTARRRTAVTVDETQAAVVAIGNGCAIVVHATLVKLDQK